MRFHIEQRFGADLSAVEHAFTDRDFLDRLASLPKLGRPTLLDQQVDGDLTHQRVRYAFVGDLSSAVRAVVDPALLTWVEDSTVDRRVHRTVFRIIPDNYGNLLKANGAVQLSPTRGGCTRAADGEVHVAVPLVGRKVEGAIVSGMQEHAALEVDVLSAWLAEAAQA